jgi:hypothetical protein
MTTEQFVYWLQGFMEVANPKTLDESQTQVIKDHLKLLFDKQTPDRDSEKSNPIINIPPNIWPNQIEPDWWGKNRIICGTDPYNGDIENPMTTKFCSTQMDPNDLVVKSVSEIYTPDKSKKDKERKSKEGRNTLSRPGIKC